MNIFKNNKGFTLLEVTSMVVVVAILTTATFVTLGNVRSKNRDMMRVTHVTQLQNSLASYYRDAGTYPEFLTPGAELTYNSVKYIDIPYNISPVDGDCTNDSYTYTQDDSGASYHLSFCLGQQTSDILAGTNTATPNGIIDGGSFIDGNTKLLLHFDNNVTDSSANAYTVTNTGVSFVTSPVKFGTHSGSFNGSSDYLSVPDSNDWNFGSGYFTFDTWVYLSSIPSVHGSNMKIINHDNVGGGQRSFTWQIITSGDISQLQYFDNSGNLTNVQTNSAFVVSGDVGNWIHLAVVVNPATQVVDFYKNGVAFATTKTNFSAYSLKDVSNTLLIGARDNDGVIDHFFDGYIDELRISKGIARWTSDFTPPTSAYE